MAITINGKKYRNLQEQVCYLTKKLENLSLEEVKTEINKLVVAINQAWEKEFLDVVVEPSQFLNNVVTLENEIFSTNNVITISAQPDNDTTIINNALNIATAELRPLVQTEEGKISLKCTTIPTENLYLRIQIEIQLDVKESE